MSTSASRARTCAEAPLTLRRAGRRRRSACATPSALWANLGHQPAAAGGRGVRRAGRPPARRDAARDRGRRGHRRGAARAWPPRRPRASACRRWCCCAGCSAAAGRYLPTGLNLVQCLGWATFEIVIIAEAASRALDAPRWPFVLGAGGAGHRDGAAAARRRCGCWRGTRVWAAARRRWSTCSSACCAEPLPQVEEGGAGSFWSAVDIVIALPVSWFPLAADYTRHVRDAADRLRRARPVGYGVATIAMFTLGVLALAAYGAGGPGRHRRAAGRAARPARGRWCCVAVEVDEAFANIYSTAVSTQNLSARLDRRVLAVVVGTVATLLALSLDVVAYEPFLFLIGAVFVPLAGVLRGRLLPAARAAPGTSPSDAPARPALLLPWAAGFVAYQLTAADLLRRHRRRLDVVVGRAPGRPRHLADQRPVGLAGQPHRRLAAHDRRGAAGRGPGQAVGPGAGPGACRLTPSRRGRSRQRPRSRRRTR